MPELTIKLKTVPGTQKDLAELHITIWKELLEFLNYYWAGEAGIKDRLTAKKYPRGNYTQDRLRYCFDDDKEGLQDYAWIRLSFAAHLDYLDSLASQHGWWLNSSREALPVVLQEMKQYLGPDEAIVMMMTPATQFVKHLQTGFTRPDTDSVISALWYVGNTTAPPIELIRDLFECAEQTKEPSIFNGVKRALDKLSPRVDFHKEILKRLNTDDPVRYSLAVTALNGCKENGHISNENYIEKLLGGIRLGEPAADVCFEFLGQSNPTDILELKNIVFKLKEAIDAGLPESAQHNAILSLVNLFLSREKIPYGLVEIFESQANSPKSYGGLSQWAITAFKTKTRVDWDNME